MNWYAIRTAPGFQVPQRERWTEPSASAISGATRGAGYRIASSVNPECTIIETELRRAGITHYMPAEFVAVRARAKKGVYELRRFALLKGYAFVGEMTDESWYRLFYVSGVQGVLATAPISSMDIHRLRMYEQNSRAVANAKIAALAKADDKRDREQRKTITRGARKKLFPGREVKLIWGAKVGRDATVAAWHDQETVSVILKGLEAAEAVTVPFEFLKAAE